MAASLPLSGINPARPESRVEQRDGDAGDRRLLLLERIGLPDGGGIVRRLGPVLRQAVNRVALPAEFQVGAVRQAVDGDLGIRAEVDAFAFPEPDPEDDRQGEAEDDAGHRRPRRRSAHQPQAFAPSQDKHGHAEQQQRNSRQGRGGGRSPPTDHDGQAREVTQQGGEPDRRDNGTRDGLRKHPRPALALPGAPEEGEAGQQEAARDDRRHAPGRRDLDLQVVPRQQLIDVKIPAENLLEQRRQADCARQHGNPGRLRPTEFDQQQDHAEDQHA